MLPAFIGQMASPSEAWMREYSEAVRLSDEITTMVPDASSLPSTGPQTQRNFSASRRKITILKTKLKSFEFLMSQPAAGRPPITEKEMNKQKDMLRNVRSKVEQMVNTLSSYSAASRDC